MTESKRKETVELIDRHFGNKSLFRRKCLELKQLLSNPAIIKYSELSKDINRVQSEYDIPQDKVIYLNFKFAQNAEPCNHEIWIYSGSYCFAHDTFNPIFNRDRYTKVAFNRYFCLDCLQTIDVPNWQEFEHTHFVLRNPHDFLVNAEDYRDVYFQLLYKYPVDEARSMFIQMFNDAKDKRKSLVTSENRR